MAVLHLVAAASSGHLVSAHVAELFDMNSFESPLFSSGLELPVAVRRPAARGRRRAAVAAQRFGAESRPRPVVAAVSRARAAGACAVGLAARHGSGRARGGAVRGRSARWLTRHFT